jgi:hypothetical protein
MNPAHCGRPPSSASALAMRSLRGLTVCGLCAAAVSCGSAGPYGHARYYAPIAGETDAVASAREYDPVMADRDPDEWGKTPVGLFAIVTHGSAQPDGTTSVDLSLRRLADRNLCETAEEDSCRVTVTEREFGTLRAVFVARAEERLGDEALGAGSLLRLVGTIKRDSSGRHYLEATYHRHWPRGTYVTTASRGSMRR